MKYLIYFLPLLILLQNCKINTEVDLIVYNAKIYTVDSLFTIHEAIAVKDGIFIDIGTSKNILKRYTSKKIIDADQKPIYPGFYDAHAHFFMLSKYFDEVDLYGCKSFDEIITRLKTYRSKHPKKKWIIGNGWDQNLWQDKAFPTKDSLDKYFPNTPIFLTRVDYHAALVNSKALNIAQLDSAKTIEGGVVQVDSIGKPNGILIDNAMALVQKFIPEDDEKELIKQLKNAQDSLFSVGLTSIVDAGLSLEELDILKIFYAKDSLKIRDYAMIYAEPKHIDKYLKEEILESDRLTIKSIKMMADGALGSRGAALLQNYNDDPSKGFLLHDPKDFETAIKKLAQSKFQVSVHAIGDSANRLILDLYGKYLANNKQRRWRLEHAQIIDENDFHKFKKYQIIPSIQPIHAISDMAWVESRIGLEREKGAYAYKSLLKQYGKVAIGTDFPIENYNPFNNFHAAVSRVNQYGLPIKGYYIDQALTREEALRGMTIWAAYSCFQEKKRGSIEKGKDADFIILDQDIMTIDLSQIRNTKVLKTILGGDIVYN